LTIGLGGLWTEALSDVACIPLPASPDRVRRALEGLRGRAVLAGARGGATYDMDGLCLVASRVGQVLLDEGFTLIEINPMIVGRNGAVVADAVMG